MFSDEKFQCHKLNVISLTIATGYIVTKEASDEVHVKKKIEQSRV